MKRLSATVIAIVFMAGLAIVPTFALGSPQNSQVHELGDKMKENKMAKDNMAGDKMEKKRKKRKKSFEAQSER